MQVDLLRDHPNNPDEMVSSNSGKTISTIQVESTRFFLLIRGMAERRKIRYNSKILCLGKQKCGSHRFLKGEWWSYQELSFRHVEFEMVITSSSNDLRRPLTMMSLDFKAEVWLEIEIC